MAFYQKYRARTFGEMVGQLHVVGTILASIQNDKLVHSYLLTGPRGIGKTSTARLLAKAINCEKILAAKAAGQETDGEPCNECQSCKDISAGRSIDIVEIDAASHTGVDDVRDLIEKARLAPAYAKKKVYIIDEVHMLSKSAFNALLKTLEEPPAHVVFIMATTEVHKIPATILSRAQRFDFKRAEKKDLIENLRRVASAEKLEIDDDVFDLIAVASAGGHRDALGLLEQVSSKNEKVTLDIARGILGIAGDQEVYSFVGAIFNNIPEEGLKIAHELYDKGFDMTELNKSVIGILRKMLLFKISGEILLDDTQEKIDQIKLLSKKRTPGEIITLLNNFIEAGSLLKDVTYPVLPIEMAVVKAAEPASQTQNSEVKIQNDNSKGINNSSKIVSEFKITKDTESKAVSSKVLSETIDDKRPTSDDHRQTTNDTVPVPVLQMTKDIWQQIIDETKKENNTLAALLRDARPAETTGNSLVLAVKFKFHREKIAEQTNRAILEKIIEQVAGHPYQISCKIEENKPIAKSANPTELEKAVGEVFEVSS